jgi:hypothetical protein
VPIKDYIAIYRERFEAIMNYNQVRRLISTGQIDYVKHDGRLYVVLNNSSMEGLTTPKKALTRVKMSLKHNVRWGLESRKM